MVAGAHRCAAPASIRSTDQEYGGALLLGATVGARPVSERRFPSAPTASDRAAPAAGRAVRRPGFARATDSRRRPSVADRNAEDAGLGLVVVVPDEVAEAVVDVGVAQPAGADQQVRVAADDDVRPGLRESTGEVLVAAAPGPSAARGPQWRSTTTTSELRAVFRTARRERSGARGRAPLQMPGVAGPAAPSGLIPSRGEASAASAAMSVPGSWRAVRRERVAAILADADDGERPVATCSQRLGHPACAVVVPRAIGLGAASPARTAVQGPSARYGTSSGSMSPPAPWDRASLCGAIAVSRFTIVRSGRLQRARFHWSQGALGAAVEQPGQVLLEVDVGAKAKVASPRGPASAFERTTPWSPRAGRVPPAGPLAR